MSFQKVDIKENEGSSIQDNDGPKDFTRQDLFQFDDHRVDTFIQRKEVDALHHSGYLEGIQNFQNAVDNSPQVRQAIQLQAMADNSTRTGDSVSQENNTGLPNVLKSGIERLSGFSMHDVKVHYNSSKPAQLQAHAYAQGTNIHIAPGQQKHLPHEAWHVVQQKQGRVRPSFQLKGVHVNNDSKLETEADVMGARAFNAGKSIDRETNKNTKTASDTHAPGLLQRAAYFRPVVQRYDDLPTDELTAWVDDHLAQNSDLRASLTWLHQQTGLNARRKKRVYDQENTEAGYKANKNIGGTGLNSGLSRLRAEYTVPNLASSKYTIKSIREINLEDDVDDDGLVLEPQDDLMGLEDESPRGVMVSSPLYAGIQDFPTNYLNGLPDDADDNYSFILAYNAHGLLSGDNPVEGALNRNELNGSRGIAIGFYWEQKLKKVEDNSDVWTNNQQFRQTFLQQANTLPKRQAFVGSLRHKKVLGTFPYGMWRNIAMNSTSVSKIMNSSWGEAHAPIFAHVTDPDADTWIDPFSDTHVAETMAQQAEDGNGNIVMGSYVYAKGTNQDNNWDRHIKNIANASSQMDALLRPALHEKLDVDYPAERNLMIKLKNADDDDNLFEDITWVAKTVMNLTTNQVNDYDGTTPQNGKTVFGLGDAEGRKLQRAIESIVDDVNILVSSAAVTTDVPGRVKGTIATTVYSDNNSDRGTGDMKSLSNVKESLIARSTNEMMLRPRGGYNDGRKLAIDEFRDRPRQLWMAIDQADKIQNRITADVVAVIDTQIDTWAKESDRRGPLHTIFTNARQLLDGDAAFFKTHLDEARDMHTSYYMLSSPFSNPSRHQCQLACNNLAPRITNIETAFAQRRNLALQLKTQLENVRGTTPAKTTVTGELQVCADKYLNHVTPSHLTDMYNLIYAKI